MITTTAALECQSNPNHITMIGAIPTIGKAATKFPTGSSPACKNGLRSIAIATRTAAPQPITYPDNAPLTKVCTKSVQSVGNSLAIRAPMADGAGKITGLISNMPTAISHSPSKLSPKINGTA